MTNSKPLKGKRFVAVLRNSNWEGYSVEDVKSAVEWLLNELNKIDAIVLETEGLIENGTPADLDEVILGTLNYVKHLIKTAFEDVMEDDTR